MTKIALLLVAFTSLAHGATPPETTVPGPPLDKVLAAAGLAHYLPKFETYGVTTFIQAVGLDEEDLAEVGMNQFDQAIFARTMTGLDKAIGERTRRTLPSSPCFTNPLCSLAFIHIPAGGGDRGWASDALKGLVAVLAAAHTAAGHVGSHISKTITAAQIELHLFMSDEERVAATKKTLLDAKDMAIAAAQAACAIVALAAMIPQVAAPAAAICAACQSAAVPMAVVGGSGSSNDQAKAKEEKKGEASAENKNNEEL